MLLAAGSRSHGQAAAPPWEAVLLRPDLQTVNPASQAPPRAVTVPSSREKMCGFFFRKNSLLLIEFLLLLRNVMISVSFNWKTTCWVKFTVSAFIWSPDLAQPRPHPVPVPWVGRQPSPPRTEVFTACCMQPAPVFPLFSLMSSTAGVGEGRESTAFLGPCLSQPHLGGTGTDGTWAFPRETLVLLRLHWCLPRAWASRRR